MKKTLLIISFLCPLSAFGEIIDRTVAVVGSEVILKSDVDKYLQQNPSGAKTFADALRELIEKIVVESDCKKLALYPSASDVKQAINDVKRQNKLDDNGLTIALQNMGMTYATYETQLYFEICKSRLVQSKIRGRVNITKDDIKRAYDQKYGLENDLRLRLRDMDVTPKSKKADDIATAKKLSADILSSLRKGDDWEKTLAKAKTSGLHLSSKNLGVIEKTDLVSVIADEVFANSSDNFRGPIEAGDGFHVFEVLERIDGPKIPLVDVEKDLHKQLFEKEVERLLRQYIEEARASTYVDIQNLDFEKN